MTALQRLTVSKVLGSMACLSHAGMPDRMKGALEVLSAPCHPQLQRLPSAAVAARRWLHGQISPPRQQLPPHLRAPWLPALSPGPLLLPGGQDDMGPTPRLHHRQDAQSEVYPPCHPCHESQYNETGHCTSRLRILYRCL